MATSMGTSTAIPWLCLLGLFWAHHLLPSITAATTSSSGSRRPGLLVVLLDGFRFDYLDQDGLGLPGFQRLAQEGARAEGLVPAFPSLSYPNYYTLMTGLYTESHGMTGNYMFDLERQEPFLIGTNPEQFHAHWWDHGDPVWITAARQGKKSHMFHWPGCEVEIRGLRPTFCRNYTGPPSVEDFSSSINQSLALLRSGETDLAAVYFELTDKYGHMYGPFSTQVNDVIRDLDPIISDLVDRLSDPALSEVNVMVFSDHGMTQVDPGNVIDVSGVLNKSEHIMMLEGAALTSIYALPGQVQQAYDKLVNFHPNMTLYKKGDLPERWHYKHGPYVAALTAVADLGYYILTAEMKQLGYGVTAGAHGYDPVHTDMLGIFLAKGPAFKRGRTAHRVHSVDLYNVMCDILAIRPSPNNGTLSDVKSLLTYVGAASALTPSAILTSGVSVLLCALFEVFVD